MKAKIQRLERQSRAKNKKEVNTPIFVFREPGGLVITREYLEALGWPTKDLPSPELDGGLYSPGDPYLCVLPETHSLHKENNGYLEINNTKIIILEWS